MLTVPNFLDFTINAVLHPTFIQKLCYKLSSITLHSDSFLSQVCLLYWMASELPRLLDTASKFVLFSVSGLKDEKLIKTNLHEKWNMLSLFWSLLNISAKFHQNWSLQFWAIPFQSWCIFETQCRHTNLGKHKNLIFINIRYLISRDSRRNEVSSLVQCMILRGAI